MKKIIVHSVLAIFSFSILVALVPGVLAQTNILSNPGFEDGLGSWNLTSGTAVYSIDTSIRHSGASSVKGVETSFISLGRLYQNVTGLVSPGTQFKISGWIKTLNVAGGVVIGLEYVSSNNYTPVDGYILEIGYVGGTNDWAFFESPTFTMPAMPSDAVALYFLIDFNMGNGTAWIDDVSLSLISGTSTPQTTLNPSDGWPMFGHDLSNARYSLSSAPKTNQILWESTFDSQIRTSVTVLEERAYVGSFNGDIFALNASTGAQIWRFSTGDSVWSTPAIANNVVYVGSNNGVIFAINASTGGKIWEFTAGGAAWSSPAVIDDVVFIGTTDNNLYALNAHTGAKIWNYTTAGHIRCSPAVVEGVVYFGSQDGTFYALDVVTGEKIWSSLTGDGDTYTNSSPAVVNNIVFVGSTDTNVYAFQTSDGRQIWKYPTGAKVSSSPAVYNGVVYVGSEDNILYAIDSLTGTKIWSQTTDGPVYSSPAVADGIVYVGSWDNTIYAFDATNGVLVWSYRTGGGVFSSPTIAGGVMFVGSYDGKVYAFGSSYSPGNFSSVAPESSNSNLTPTAWAPTIESGVVGVIVTAGAISIAAMGIAAASSATAGATTGSVGKLIDKVREFLPKTIKRWLEGIIASKRKMKIEEKTGSPYLPTKSEVVVYIVSILVMTFSFAYVQVINLSQFLLILPTFFATSILVAFVRTYILTICARRRGVWTEFKLWYFGVAMFLFSTLAFRFPFSSPTRTIHHSSKLTKPLAVLLSCANVIITLGFAGLFFILLKSGFAVIGGAGLAMCLIAAFFDMFPIEPMSGKTIFIHNKMIWVGLFLITLVMYAAWIAKIF